MRDIYEAPAASIILPAHQELEKLVCTIHQNQFKAGLDRQWAYLVYAGLWWEPLRGDLDAYMESVNAQVTGTVGVELYKGTARVITRASPNAVYDRSLASFAESGGLFSQTASPGFIELWTLQSRMAWRLRNRSRLDALSALSCCADAGYGQPESTRWRSARGTVAASVASVARRRGRGSARSAPLIRAPSSRAGSGSARGGGSSRCAGCRAGRAPRRRPGPRRRARRRRTISAPSTTYHASSSSWCMCSGAM